MIQTFGTDCFDFRNDDVRMIFFNHLIQSISIQHTEHFARIGNLHGRSIRIRITRNYILSQTLSSNHKLFSQFAGTQQKYFLSHKS